MESHLGNWTCSCDKIILADPIMSRDYIEIYLLDVVIGQWTSTYVTGENNYMITYVQTDSPISDKDEWKKTFTFIPDDSASSLFSDKIGIFDENKYPKGSVGYGEIGSFFDICENTNGIIDDMGVVVDYDNQLPVICYTKINSDGKIYAIKLDLPFDT